MCHELKKNIDSIGTTLSDRPLRQLSHHISPINPYPGGWGSLVLNLMLPSKNMDPWTQDPEGSTSLILIKPRTMNQVPGLISSRKSRALISERVTQHYPFLSLIQFKL